VCPIYFPAIEILKKTLGCSASNPAQSVPSDDPKMQRCQRALRGCNVCAELVDGAYVSHPMKFFATERLRIIVGCSTALLLLTWPSAAWPCKCGATPGYDPWDDPLIFVGEVATVERVEANPDAGHRQYTKACLDSEYSLWGVPANNRRVCVSTGTSETSDCSIPFRVGEHYMVFAKENPYYWEYSNVHLGAPPDAGLLFTEKCLGTYLLHRDAPPPPSPASPLLPVLATALVSFAVGLLVRGRRRK
jgi:hypothetical protein